MTERAVLTTVDDERWRQLLRVAPGVTPFHHPAWAQLLADCYRYEARVVGMVDGDDTMVAGLPLIDVSSPLGRRRWVSLPFSDACAPVTTSDGARRSLVTGLDELRLTEGVTRVEVRSALPAPAAPSPSGAVLHRRALPATVEELSPTINRSLRQNVRSATRRGVTVRRGERRDDLARTFHALQVLTRRRHGVPAQPRAYFELLWDRILARDLGYLLLAEADGEPIAGCVFLCWRDYLVFKYGASDPAAWDRRPNDLLMWHGLVAGVERGCTTADLGRSDLPEDGLWLFKRRLGGVEETLTYSTLGAAAHDGRGRLTRLAGPVLRHGPRWLTRASGRVLYRHAA
ncbi:MAG: GNAT family N-acetyltransferase [Acidimicrobiales bacterium]|jgi:CelD/BcsL family acetyltransferase involved in cellulose biosynthesis|nr:GNAT family N-acetyltransferase [Acidimicrobiales bacterium]